MSARLQGAGTADSLGPGPSPDTPSVSASEQESPPESAAAPPRPLRLTIGLLLLWTTTTALTLGLASGLSRSRNWEIDFYRYPETFRQMFWFQDLMWFIASPAYGAALAATAIAVWRAIRQVGGFPTQPGHWIAVLLGFATLGFFAAMLPSPDRPARRVVATAVTAVLAVVSCLAASATKGPRRWRATMITGAGGLCGLLAVLIASRAAELDGNMPTVWLLMMLPGLVIALAALMAGVATIIDLVQRPKFDLFHWLGTGTLLVLVVHPIAALVLLRLYW